MSRRTQYSVKPIVRYPVPGHSRIEGYAVVHKGEGSKVIADGQFSINPDRSEAVARYLADVLCKDLNEGIE